MEDMQAVASGSSLSGLAGSVHDEQPQARPVSLSHQVPRLTNAITLYGSSTNRNWTSSTKLVASCAGRTSGGCKSQVVAVRRDGAWVLDSEETRWTHNHDREGEAAQPAYRSSDESELTDLPSDEENEDEPMDGDEDEDDANTRNPKRSAPSAAPVPQLPMPDLPQPGDTFPTSQAFEAAAIRAVLPVYGYGLQPYNSRATRVTSRCNSHANTPAACRFRIACARDPASGRWVVEREGSVYAHDHGARAEIVADPAWRPTVVREATRALLGLPPGKRARDKARREDEERRQATKAKKERMKERKARSKEEKTKSPSPPKKKRRVAVRDDHSPTSWAMPPPAAPPASTSRARPAPPEAPAARPALAPVAAPHTAQTSAPLARKCAVKPAPPPVPHTHAPSDFLPGLTAFLTALHPSLSPLAAPLLRADISSPSALADLALLEPPAREAFLELVRERSTGVSVVQVKMLGRVLGEWEGE
ncbi:hypothetical protein JCM10450v2_002184 [Rhodotorula kratochvilovae]